jgi:hypothetical protein
LWREEGKGRHTFPPTSKLHADLLVHVLSQVEDVFFLWPLAIAGVSTATAFVSASRAASSSAVFTFELLAFWLPLPAVEGLVVEGKEKDETMKRGTQTSTATPSSSMLTSFRH